MPPNLKIFSNLFNKDFGYSNLFSLLTAYLSFADLDLLFLSISFFEGLKTFILVLNQTMLNRFYFQENI